MERKNKKTEEVPDNKITFIKQGGGSCRMHGKIIKPGEKIRMDPERIPMALRTFFKPIDKDADKLKKDIDSPIPGNKALYEVEERKTKGLFDVVNKETQKPLNDSGLTEDEAKDLKDALNA